MKRIITAALTALILLTAAACGTEPENAGFLAQNTSAPPPPATFVPVTPNEIHVKQVVGSRYAEDIKVADLQPDQFLVTTVMDIDWDYIVSQKDAWGAHQYEATIAWQQTFPGGNMAIRTVPGNEVNASLVAWTAGGEAPDLIGGDSDNFPLRPARGLTADMKWYADILDLYNSDIYNQSIMDLYSWRGEFPWAVANEAVTKYYIIYNKSLFDEAGVKTPFEHWQDGNWTWTQFVKTAKEMTVGDEQYGFTGWGLFPYQAPYAMASLDGNGNVVLNIDDPKYMRYMAEVHNFYHVDNAGRLGWGLQDWSVLLPVNIDAMVITSLSSFARMSRNAARRHTGADLRVAPLFRFDPNGETEPISPAWAWGYSISRAARAPVGAANYIRLESLVGQNILAAYGFDWHGFVNAEERAMIEDFEANGKSVVEVIFGVGDSYLGILDAVLVPAIYFGPAAGTIHDAFNAVRRLLEAEVAAFNETP
jgi:ABC-type glycerol-3-phosphate transport system substrate-binding protein